jgi:hypothetical protein
MEAEMNSVHLMNSAMMPKPGLYYLEPMNKFHNIGFRGIVDHFWRRKGYMVQSSIGYPQNAEMLTEIIGRDLCDEIFGGPVPVSMAQISPEPGDIMLIMRLKYRTRSKGELVSPQDFEYFYAVFGYHEQAIMRVVGEIESLDA